MSHNSQSADPGLPAPNIKPVIVSRGQKPVHDVFSQRPLAARITANAPAGINRELSLGQDSDVLSELRIAEILGVFQQLMLLNVAKGNPSPCTIRAYLTDGRDYLKYLQKRGISLALVTEEVVNDYQAQLLKQFKANTANRKFVSVRRLHQMFFVSGLLRCNPAAKVTSPIRETGKSERVACISKLQMEKMLARSDEQHQHTANKQIKAWRDQALLLLVMGHGLSECEVVTLNVESVIVQPNGEISMLQIRDAHERWREIRPILQLQVVLKKWLSANQLMHVEANQDGTPLFISLHWGDNGHGKGGRRLSTRGVRKTIDTYLTAVGAKKTGVSGQALRHSFAIWSIFDGADPRAIQRELGHASSEAVKRYSRFVDDMKRHPAAHSSSPEISSSSSSRESTIRNKEKQSKKS